MLCNASLPRPPPLPHALRAPVASSAPGDLGLGEDPRGNGSGPPAIPPHRRPLAHRSSEVSRVVWGRDPWCGAAT